MKAKLPKISADQNPSRNRNEAELRVGNEPRALVQSFPAEGPVRLVPSGSDLKQRTSAEEKKALSVSINMRIERTSPSRISIN